MSTAAIATPTKPQQFRFYVEASGNNHQTVKWIVKRRSWMNSSDMPQNIIQSWSGPIVQMVSLVWT